MASYSDYTYRINGVLSTDKTVMQNIEELANATAAWVTYDTHEGLWSVVVNQAETSVASFDDSNIVGSITINSSGLENLYNSVRVEFPHIDLRDEKDFVLDSILEADRIPNEIDNTLNIQYDVLNDPIQAEYLGLIELKQNRLDLVITFNTDFSQLGLKAGDVIDVTSSVYGFVNKMFRIEKLQERDTDDGSIEIAITAREYSDSVYDANLERFTRENSTGIVTLGNIGIPGTPTVSKVEQDARPRVTISSTTPTGTVEALEFWFTTDTYILDENRVYKLLDSVKPSQGNTFPFGNTVSITNDGLSSGNLYVKTRGINGQTVGPFSEPAGFVYTPVQTTNNIDENTSVSSSTGGIVAALGALTLLNNLDQLFSGNTAAGSVFNKVFDLFKDETGSDLLDPNSHLMISASTGREDNIIATQSADEFDYQTVHEFFFTAPTSGTYKFDYQIDQNTSGAKGGRGSYWSEPHDEVSVSVSVYDSSNLLLSGIASGGYGTFFWTDFVLADKIDLTGGQEYTVVFDVINYTESTPTGEAQFDFSWNIYTVE